MDTKDYDQLFSIENQHLSKLHSIVKQTMKDEELIINNLMHPPEENLTAGQSLSDKIARFGGSWMFIILFFVVLISWIVLNSLLPGGEAFDPYPFILMNLVLSCIAALQAPIIMMSQNRQEEKDRERAKKDYMINLKSEVEIRLLHDKIDHLIIHQQQELLEMQKIQLDTMKDLLLKHKEGKQ